MSALTVIKHFDIIKNIAVGLLPRSVERFLYPSTIHQPTEQPNRPATDVVTDKGVSQSDTRVCHCEAVSPLASAGNVNAHCCCLQCPRNIVHISLPLASSGQSDTRLVSLSVYSQSLSGECVTAVISLPAGLFNTVNSRVASAAVLPPLIMTATPYAVPRWHRYRCFQIADDTA